MCQFTSLLTEHFDLQWRLLHKLIYQNSPSFTRQLGYWIFLEITMS